MGAALLIFVILSLSIFIVRIAAIALRSTGITETTARFQALSAFTGAGFTTSETEAVVNYPVRRQIISLLIILGNMGLLTVLSTLVVSMVRTDGDTEAVVVQLAWIIGSMALLWFVMLNKTADRILCDWIGIFLERTTVLGKRRFHRLLQVSDGYSVCEHQVPPRLLGQPSDSVREFLRSADLVPLMIHTAQGEHIDPDTWQQPLTAQNTLVLFGPDAVHELFDEPQMMA